MSTRPTKAERRRIGRSIRKARRQRALVERFVVLGAGGLFAAAEELVNAFARMAVQVIRTFEGLFLDVHADRLAREHRDWMLTYRALEAAPERAIRGFAAAQVWHDEAQRYEATGRLDEGPCWCQECVQTELDRGETEPQQ